MMKPGQAKLVKAGTTRADLEADLAALAELDPGDLSVLSRDRADRIWIVNVGDLKPMEFPIEFFLSLAWNPQRWPKESSALNRAMPAVNMGLGPIRSPSLPAVMTSTASTRAYALITQRMSSSDACSFVSMLGIAMLTIVRSSRVMKNPSETTSNTAHGLPRNFFTTSPWRLPRRSGPPEITG